MRDEPLVDPFWSTLENRRMTKIINLYEAKTHLSDLVERAAAGEEIVIAKAGRPKARLVPLQKAQRPRKPGLWKGAVWIADDFDAPLPEEILVGFEGGEDEPPS
jgi:prevent-host-death family protein